MNKKQFGDYVEKQLRKGSVVGICCGELPKDWIDYLLKRRKIKTQKGIWGYYHFLKVVKNN